MGFLGGSEVKNPPARKHETQVRSLGWDDPLEKEATTYSSILALEIPWTEELGRLQSMGSQTSQGCKHHILVFKSSKIKMSTIKKIDNNKC